MCYNQVLTQGEMQTDIFVSSVPSIQSSQISVQLELIDKHRKVQDRLSIWQVVKALSAVLSFVG